MFPKNWSKTRIQEEVAFVYENTVYKNIGFVCEVNQISTYEGFSSNGFKINIQIKNGKIINSHPKIY